MLIRSGSPLLLLAYLVTLLVLLGLLASVVTLLFGKGRTAARIALVSVAAFGANYILISAISWLSPQRIIARGDSYCWDLWCMGVDDVSATPRGSDVVYRVDVHFFSDANSVKTSTDGARIYLVDDRGRQFSIVDDPAVIPISTTLQPRQSLKTSLTFIAPADAQRLYLTGDAPLPSHLPLGWQLLKVYADLHIGYEKLSHQPTVLRVL